MSKNIEYSFEFFPPKTEVGREKLEQTRDKLAALKPEYFSVTYGAGGSTRDNTRDTVLGIKQVGLDVAPHLSFGADDEELVGNLLQSYVDAGINRVVALRGDLPSGMGAQRLVYANELVEFIREKFADHFNIAVACYPEVHPQAKGYKEDVGYLKQKLDAGADYAVTQYFYDTDAFSCFMDECGHAGIDKPIVAGIMPITNMDNLIRFSEACGADIPRWLKKSLADRKENQRDLLAYGEVVVTRLCEKLIAEGVESFHFYTMNQYGPTANICRNLGLIGDCSEAEPLST